MPIRTEKNSYYFLAFFIRDRIQENAFAFSYTCKNHKCKGYPDHLAPFDSSALFFLNTQKCTFLIVRKKQLKK